MKTNLRESPTGRALDLFDDIVHVHQYKSHKGVWETAQVRWASYGRTSVEDARKFAEAVHKGADIAAAWNLEGKRVTTRQPLGLVGTVTSVEIEDNGDCTLTVKWDNDTVDRLMTIYMLVEVTK